MADSTHEFDYQHHVRTYLFVFAALAVLTVVTVAVGYLNLPEPIAVASAILIATVKGSLVATYFMHLISERKAIYWLLGLTAFFFAVLLLWPTMDESLGMGDDAALVQPQMHGAVEHAGEHH